MLVAFTIIDLLLLGAILYLLFSGDGRSNTISVTTRKNWTEGESPPDHILITFLKDQELGKHFKKQWERDGRS